MRYRNICLLVFLSAFAFACSRGPQPRKRLLLFLVADQFPQEFIERYSPLFTGGLKRLLDEGAVYNQASFMHAATETCPGHASLVSGVYPSKHGIVSNTWSRLNGQEQYCVRDKKGSYTAKNTKVSNLFDWIKKAYPKSKLITISAKDRAALTLAGKQLKSAHWVGRKSGALKTLAKGKSSLAKANSSLEARSWFPKIWEDSFLEQALERLHPGDSAESRQ